MVILTRTAILYFPLYEIVVSLGTKVEFENIAVSFLSFIPFHPEQQTNEDK